MLNQFFIKSSKSLLLAPKYAYHFPPRHNIIVQAPGLTAKRIIKCVSQRLKKFDPEKWEGVPFSFNTHWRDEAGYYDVETCIQASEAIEREFGIDVKDRHLLITDIATAFCVVTEHHDSL